MAEILFIAPFSELAELAKDLSTQGMSTKGESGVDIRIARMEKGVKLALEAEKNGYQVLVSRGVTSWMIRKAQISLPVVDVLIGGVDILKAYLQAKKISENIGIVDVKEIIEEVISFEEIMGKCFVKCTLSDQKFQQEDILKGMTFLKQSGVEVVIGKVAMANAARKLGMQAVVISSGRETVSRALAEARRVSEVRKQEKRLTEQLKAILDFTYDGVIALDNKGRINVFNPVVEKLSGWSAEKAIGRFVTEVLPKAHCQTLLQTGKSEIGEIMDIGGSKVVANRIPIIVDHRVEGVVTTFQPIDRLQRLEHKVRRTLADRGHVAKYNFDDILGQSKVINDAIWLAHEYAQVDSTVLLHGKTGTGKEMFAQAIHNASPRKQGPFVAINCAALPENLLESELFGYVEGAFTGARKGGKAGVFETAHGGTLFLDEVGEMALSSQSRVLRVLEEGEIMRLGDSSILPVNVRLVAATHRDLQMMVENGSFREDLFYRLNVLSLVIPKLAARSSDIMLLARYFLQELTHKMNRSVGDFHPEAENVMLSYGWPGNIRELRNTMERLVMLTWDRDITAEDMKKVIPLVDTFGRTDESTREQENIGKLVQNGREEGLSDELGSYEIHLLKKTLEACGGNKTKAARRLGISRTTLWRKLQEHQQHYQYQ